MSKVINLAERRAQKTAEKQNQTQYGSLIWLHCPQCQTLEYTITPMPGGRYHKCGTLVEEAVVQIDLRAEYTMSLRNSQRLQEWKAKVNHKILGLVLRQVQPLLEQMEVNEREYRQRLEKLNGGAVTPYAEEWTPAQAQIEVLITEPFRLELSPARQSQRYFPKLSSSPSQNTP